MVIELESSRPMQSAILMMFAILMQQKLIVSMSKIKTQRVKMMRMESQRNNKSKAKLMMMMKMLGQFSTSQRQGSLERREIRNSITKKLNKGTLTRVNCKS